MNHNRLLRTLFLALTLLSLSVDLRAMAMFPDEDLAWKNVVVNNRTTTVFTLSNDKSGLIWLGTNNGLYYYDGVTVHPVASTTLTGVQIYSIVPHDNLLYLGSNNGLLAYDIATNSIIQCGNKVVKEIRCMAHINDALWIGSLYGVYAYDFTSGQFTDKSAGLPHRSTYSIMRDSRGIIYAGTYDGLGRWNDNRQQFVAVAFPNLSSNNKNLFVNCLYESTDCENILIGTEGALYQFNPTNGTWQNIHEVESNNIKCLSSDGSNNIFIGTDNGIFISNNDGTYHFRHDSRQPQSLAHNEVWCIMHDRYDNLWAGHEHGFSITSQSDDVYPIKLGALTKSGEGNDIHVITRDSRNNLWLGGANGVIKVPQSGQSTWYRHNKKPGALSHNRVRAITEDTDHTIWLSTDGGVNRYNPLTDSFDIFLAVDKHGKHNTNWVYSIIDDDNNYWIGSYLGGIHRVPKQKFGPHGSTVTSDFTINSDSTSDCRIINDFINNVITDKRGNLWILLFRAPNVSRYDKTTGALDSYDIFKLTGSYPTKIALDNDDRLWCSIHGGVVIIDNNDTCKIVRFAEPTENEAVIAMAPVDGDMWVSTQNNVWKIDGSDFTTIMLPVPQRSYTSVYADAITGKILLGANDEVIAVNPKIINDAITSTSIKSIITVNSDGTYGILESDGTQPPLTLPYGGNLTLYVSSLDYNPNVLHRYMYRMTDRNGNASSDWIVMPEDVNNITLTDLKMGHYNLLVAIAGHPDAATAIPLKVNPPIALSWWMLCIYFSIAGIIVYIIVWNVMRRNKLRQQEIDRKKTLDSVEKKLTFLSDISHDLKTPLSMILGPVSLLKENATNETDRHTLETVYDNAVRLNNMIHRTLELNHLEDTDEDLLIMSVFDVIDFCRGVFDSFKELHTNKTFIFHSSCRQLLIEGDAVKLESVMTNLLSNACKYSDDGATISCGISQQGNNVEIVVSDDGLGIAERDQALVFQRMFRSQSTAKLREGTGLGLYLIKRYLELMHGNVELISREGQGTAFIVTIPVSNKEVSSIEISRQPTDSDKPKILIVEDNAQILAFIAKILSTEYTVLTAANGRTGLSIAQSFQPDLIIADEMMPIMTGMEMCRQIKQNPRLKSTPIIMLTAKSDVATENESIRTGIDTFMSKPFEPKALLGRIEHLLSSRRTIKEDLIIESITEVKPIEAESSTEKQLARIAKIIEDNIADPDLNVNMLCEKSEISNKQLYRIIKKYIGLAPLDYIRRVRLQKAAMLLSQHRFTVSEISYMVGFKTPSYFAKCFLAQYGVKPSQYHSDDQS